MRELDLGRPDGGHSFHIGAQFGHALPQGFGTGRGIVLAPQPAAKAGHDTDNGAQVRRCRGRWGVVVHHPGGLPFFDREDHFAAPVGMFPPDRHQHQDAPGDDQIQYQDPLQPFHGAKLQGFDLAAGFEDAEIDFDPPAPAVPFDASPGRFQIGDRLVGDQALFDRFLTFGGMFFPGQKDADLGTWTASGLQFDPGGPDRLFHQPGRVLVAGRQVEANRAQSRLGFDRRPQFVVHRVPSLRSCWTRIR